MSVTNETFNERFKKLFHEGETQEQFAQRVGLNRNTVAKYKNAKNNTAPDAGVIISICRACNVSADWLLGLAPADVQKPDPTLQAACEYTGLSEEAVTTIRYLKDMEDAPDYPFPAKMPILEYLLSQKKFTWFFILLEHISQYFDAMEKYEVYKDTIHSMHNELSENKNLWDIRNMRYDEKTGYYLCYPYEAAESFLNVAADDLKRIFRKDGES